METQTKVMTVEELTAVNQKLIALHGEMTYLAKLAPAERVAKKGRRLGATKLRLLLNQIAAARRNHELLPPTFDLPSLEQEATLVSALAELVATLGKLYDDVNDTLLVVGSPVLVNAKAAKAYIKVAATSAQHLEPAEHLRRNRSSRPTAPPSVVPGPAGTTETPADPTKQAA